MAKFLVVHPVGTEVTLEGATPVAKAAKAHSTLDAYWVRSWYAREEGKLFCEWDGKDAESVSEVLAEGAPDFRVEGIYEMEMMVDSEDFRQAARGPGRARTGRERRSLRSTARPVALGELVTSARVIHSASLSAATWAATGSSSRVGKLYRCEADGGQ